MNQTLVEQKESFIEQELKKFNVVEAELSALADAGRGLTINGINDKEGLEKVKRSRIAIKNERVRIEKAGKSLRDQANAFNKAVLSKEKEYLAIITPVEDSLAAEEKKVADELARIEREKQEAVQRKIQSRIDALAKVGHVIDFSIVSSLSDEDYESRLAEATEEYTKEQQAIADAKEAARIESERLAAVAAEQAKEKKRLEELAAEQLRKEREMELQQEKLRLQQEAVEKQKYWQEQQIVREQEAKAKYEKELAEAEVRAKERVEQDLKDKAAAEARRAELAPDKDKLIALAETLDQLPMPSLSIDDAEKVLTNVKGLIGKVSAYIHDQVTKL